MILVAGGNGFVGRSLCKRLTELELDILSLDLEQGDASEYPCLEVDITNRNSLERVFDEYPLQVVVNLAVVLFSAAIKDPSRAFLVNVFGSFNLLDLCRLKGVRRFIFGSSYAAIGDQPGLSEPVSERLPPQPTDYYGETKCFAEKLGIAFADRYEIEFASARIPLVVGPGKPTSTSAWRAEIFNKLNFGGVVRIDYAVNETLPLAHHSDVAEALVALILADKLNHSIYHLPSEKWRVLDLGETVEEISAGLMVEYGDRRITGAPQTVSWERIRQEFRLQSPDLRAHLLEHRG
ncbi:MAG TPA: NAD(P)-dependent oxidoreductase [Anaerolineae bacterium]|nr:NAD(P)-dependent oxidoreductase [Anaerolineae bacterium]